MNSFPGRTFLLVNFQVAEFSMNDIQLKNRQLLTDGVLVEIGYLPNTQFLEGVLLNERNEIIIDANNQTNIPRLFALQTI